MHKFGWMPPTYIHPKLKSFIMDTIDGKELYPKNKMGRNRGRTKIWKNLHVLTKNRSLQFSTRHVI